MNKDKRQIGFSLIEILVTILIMSIALLSSATLQMLSKRGNVDAAQRTTAAHLAGDLFSRMRANRAALANYIPAGTIGTGSVAVPAANCLNPAVVCTALQMAAFDMWQWEQHLDGQMEQVGGNGTGGLNLATACITGPAGGISGDYRIVIAWRGMVETSNPVIDGCGVGVQDYGTDNRYRRILVMQSFVSAG